MEADFEPAMAPAERAASLVAFELRWPFPENCWRIGRTEIRPHGDSYEAARTAVEAGRRVASIAGTATSRSPARGGAAPAASRCCSGPTRSRRAIGGSWAAGSGRSEVVGLPLQPPDRGVERP
jgi:hypothetical protein